MFFGQIDTTDAVDCYLAHSIKTSAGRLSKGTQLTPALVDQLINNGFTCISVARLEPDDIHENDAAHQLATSICGDGVRLTKARTGRVNLHATVSGLCDFDRDTIIAINSVSHAITLSTLASNQWVPAGRLIATIKIMPYAVPNADLRSTMSIGESSNTRISVLQPTPKLAYLVQTRLAGTAESILNKTTDVTRQRLIARTATLVKEERCTHASNELAVRLKNIVQTHPSHTDQDESVWIIIAGASAICDIDDVIPSAIVAAGGEIQRLGIPVDPGNLLLIGQLGHITIIGLPGCARVPKYNGFDQVLDRMACDLPLSDEWLNSLSVGGLMNERVSNVAN